METGQLRRLVVDRSHWIVLWSVVSNGRIGGSRKVWVRAFGGEVGRGGGGRPHCCGVDGPGLPRRVQVLLLLPVTTQGHLGSLATGC